MAEDALGAYGALRDLHGSLWPLCPWSQKAKRLEQTLERLRQR